MKYKLEHRGETPAEDDWILTRRYLFFFWVWIASGTLEYCSEFIEKDYTNELSKRW